jgi:circadian clock protein KaiC
MKGNNRQLGARLPGKAPTGIHGFDQITGGGLPRHRTTLVMGEPGAGKTVFGLQALLHGASQLGEPGIFVAFEERCSDIAANARAFGWDVDGLQDSGRIFLLDAHIGPDIMRSGHFDLNGLLASLKAQSDAMGARRVVFDAVDVLLRHLDHPTTQRQEVYRLYEWLAATQLTGLLTAAITPAEQGLDAAQPYTIIQAIADCAVRLSHQLHDDVSLRTVRVLKYRGSGFLANAYPLSIGPRGIEVAGLDNLAGDYPVPDERLSSGVAPLDEMLGGGYFRGASILVSGAPGTAKSTLAGAFIDAACRRGEACLYAAFDEAANELVRNLRSVNIHLAPWVEAGRLMIHAGRAEVYGAEEHLLALRDLIDRTGARCLVVDPLSALVRAGGHATALGAAKRLLHLAKVRGITMLATSLLETRQPELEATELQISTLADTWIHLSYVAHEGERNRAITIVKSRGTWHSNQVRELLLSDEGITLKDVYTADGQVLMGTARWQQEQVELRQRELVRRELEQQRHELAAAESELQARIEALRRELEIRRARLTALEDDYNRREAARLRRVAQLRQLRGVSGDGASAAAASADDGPAAADARVLPGGRGEPAL